MIERTEKRFGIKPAYLAADTAYGSADTLNWIVNEKKIAPHILVIDKSKREDGMQRMLQKLKELGYVESQTIRFSNIALPG
jgi:hypothetical protein